MASSRRPSALPRDAAEHVARLPEWLQESAAGAFQAVDESAARQAAREQNDANAEQRRQQAALTAANALRGDWGKEAQAAVTRVLGGVTPLRAEVAQLVLCESIVKEEQKRRRAKKRVQHFGRGAK